MGWMWALRDMRDTLARLGENREMGVKVLKRGAELISRDLAKVGCKFSAAAADRLSTQMSEKWTDEVFKIRTDELYANIMEEVGSHQFFWVPSNRAEWYGKKAEEIAGSLWCPRFPSTCSEIEEASKCYAFGRYTSAAFHLMRAVEPGTKALGLAIGLTPAHPGWKLVFDEVYGQWKKHRPRHPIWTTHEAALVQISGDLRTVSLVWRNDVAHFVDTYGEENAKEMLTIVPVFMRNLSAMIDEKGTLY